MITANDKIIQHPQINEEYISRINRVMDYIDSNLDKELSLEFLAGIAHFSPFHFHRIFSAVVGETLNRCIKRKRLQKATFRLARKPEQSITRIAYDCGFNSSAAFARAFRSHYKMSPSEWREDHTNKDIEDFSKVASGNLEVKELPDMTVASISQFGLSLDSDDNDSIMASLFEKLTKWAYLNGIPYTEETKVFSLIHDFTDYDDLSKGRFSACITIPDVTVASGEINKMLIPGRKYAIGHFTIKRDKTLEAWERLISWIPENGYEAYSEDSILGIEIYRYVPRIFKEGIFMLDLCIPVKPL